MKKGKRAVVMLVVLIVCVLILFFAIGIDGKKENKTSGNSRLWATEEDGSSEQSSEDGQESPENNQIPEGDSSLDNEMEIPWDLEE